MTTSRVTPGCLREALAHAERHIATLEDSIEKQQRFVVRLESHGEFTTIEIARALLAIMEAARSSYLGDRDRITRMLTKQSR